MKHKILVIFSILVLSSICFCVVASADTIMNYNQGYFNLDLSNTSHISGSSIKNAKGVPYAIYNNILEDTMVAHHPQFASIALYSIYIKYNATKGTTTYDSYIYAPVTVSNYMAVPETITDSNGNTIYRTPLAVLLDASLWWNFSFTGAYSHSRFAVSIDNNKNLVVIINPSFYATYDIFLGAYNNQDEATPINFIGLLSCKSTNPLIDNNTSYEKGYSDGYSVGKVDGQNNAVSPIGTLFGGVNSILSVRLFGDVTLGLIVYAMLGLSALLIFAKLFKG